MASWLGLGSSSDDRWIKLLENGAVSADGKALLEGLGSKKIALAVGLKARGDAAPPALRTALGAPPPNESETGVDAWAWREPLEEFAAARKADR